MALVTTPRVSSYVLREPVEHGLGAALELQVAVPPGRAALDPLQLLSAMGMLSYMAMRCRMMIAVVIGWGDTRQRTPSNAAGQRAIAQNVAFAPVHRLNSPTAI
jgi:hypothetical protein